MKSQMIAQKTKLAATPRRKMAAMVAMSFEVQLVILYLIPQVIIATKGNAIQHVKKVRLV